MNHDLEINKYFSESKYIYDSSVERNTFEEICCNYGLVKEDENTYILPEEKTVIVKDGDGYHYQNQKLTISSKDNYIEASGIPVDETMQSSSIIHFIYQFHYNITKDAFHPCADESVKIYSLRGLILFLELIKYYGYSTDLSSKECADKVKKFNKRIEKCHNSNLCNLKCYNTK